MGAMRLYRFRSVGDPGGRRGGMTPGVAVVLRRSYRGDPGLFDIFKSVGGAVLNAATGGVSGLLTSAYKAITAKPTPPPPPPGTALITQTPTLPTTRGTIAGAVGGPGIGGSISLGPAGFRLAGGATAGGGAAGVGSLNMDDTGGDTTAAQAATPVCTIKGYHFNKRGYFTKAGYVPAHSKCVKNRRRNPLNPRALHRAASRMIGFQSAATKIEKSLHKLVKRSPATRRLAAPARSSGHKPGCGCVVCRR